MKEEKIERPQWFKEFVWQTQIKKIIQTAIASSKTNKHTLGHILLSWQSGFGKTTLAQLIAREMNVKIQQVTGYAITKPAEIISLLQKLNKDDVLFIDEIHRIKANLEEILYIAMEDQRIDLIMPDGTHLNIPIERFTLIGATTKPESLTTPLKNRFVYSFHLEDYNREEKHAIIQRYIQQLWIIAEKGTIEGINTKTDSTPRNIKNLCIKIRDFLISKNTRKLTLALRKECEQRIDIDDHGMTILHKKYLKAFLQRDKPLSLKTLATKIGVNEKTIENDIEPLLLKLWYIEKTPKGRVQNQDI